MFTDLTLSQILRNASASRRKRMLDPLNAAIEAYEINTPLRAAAFIAQIGHESGELHYMEEIWGPTAAQKRYEPPSKLATRLGNSEAGDGRRFKGRGPIQITGRANYRRYGELLGIDLVANPERAAEPETGFRIAGLFWTANGLNELADVSDFQGITQRINGGQNGAAEREAFYDRAKVVLGAAPTSAAQAPRAVAAAPSGKASKDPARVFNVRADTMDFRDLMYVPSLVEVPTHIPLGDYLDKDVPILDQGSEGACTGFGLATVANYLLLRRQVLPDNRPVSPRMCYELARRYDEWPGENYSGSSARGAMKGWHKHGICAETIWPYQSDIDGLTDECVEDARRRPLGAYFRVNHRDLVAMHSAIAEVGVLYATCIVHSGWQRVDATGHIVQADDVLGGHAFALVAYDDEGFWLQNSWGPDWGRKGFARISYDDWLANGTDVWVARLGAPVSLRRLQSTATAHATTSGQSVAYSFRDLRPHIISVGNDGRLKPGGDYGSTPKELERIFSVDIRNLVKDWKRPRLLLHAHGGLNSEQSAVQRLAEYRPALLDSEVYPLAFIWRTDYWSTIANILEDAVRRRRPEGVLDSAKDFMLDRLDDALEPLARVLTGKSAWDEMKENALAASLPGGAAVLVADNLVRLSERFPDLEIHLIGHSAGAILLAPFLKLLSDRQLRVETCTLWAPACGVDLYRSSYLRAAQAGTLARLALFALREEIEEADDCARIYNKSLLYLVSNAFEKKPRIPGFRDGMPILGLEKFLTPDLRAELQAAGGELVLAPNDEPLGSVNASQARHHGDFDDDERTVRAAFERITRSGADALAPMRAGATASATASTETAQEKNAACSRPAAFQRSSFSLRQQRQQIDQKTQV
jgi:predicted chitinase